MASLAHDIPSGFQLIFFLASLLR